MGVPRQKINNKKKKKKKTRKKAKKKNKGKNKKKRQKERKKKGGIFFWAAIRDTCVLCFPPGLRRSEALFTGEPQRNVLSLVGSIYAFFCYCAKRNTTPTAFQDNTSPLDVHRLPVSSIQGLECFKENGMACSQVR